MMNIQKKALFPIEVIEEEIVICVNDEHLEKAKFPIEITEEGTNNNNQEFLNLLLNQNKIEIETECFKEGIAFLNGEILPKCFKTFS